VLVRQTASPAKQSPAKQSPAKRRRTLAKNTPVKAELTLDSSGYEFSKDYSEEERAYQELRGRTGAHRAAISLKETHYEEDEEDEEEEEDEEDEEKDEEDEEEEEEEEDEDEAEDDDEVEYQISVLDEANDLEGEEPEDFIIAPRQSIFSPIKNGILFVYFFIHNIITSTFRAITSLINRSLELFVYTPILFIVDSFKSLFHTLNQLINRLLALLGAGAHNQWVKKAFAATIAVSLLTLATPPTVHFLDNQGLFKALSNLRFTTPGTYIPPDLPPGSAEEIVDRLLELERQLSSYSALSQQVLLQNKALRQDNEDEKIRRAAIDDSIYLLKQDLEKLNTFAKSSTSHIGDLRQFHRDTKASIKEIHENIMRLDSDVEKHETDLKTRNSKSDVAISEMKNLKTNIDLFKKDLHRLEGELKKVSDYEYISKIAIKSIQDWLPPQLAVRVNPKTKKIEATPEFWTALRGVFADRTEMEKSVASQASKIADAKVVQKEISWHEFLKGNEEAIKGFVKVQMDEKWNQAGEEGVIVSRDYFMEILKDQVASLHGDMEGKMKGLMDKFEKSSKENLSKAVATAEAMIKRVKKSGGGKGDLSSEAMERIVETAIHKYATDTLAKPDYALYSSGARINPLLTSPTYFHSPKSVIKRLGSYVFGGAGATWGHQPAMALFQDTNVGMCWAFPGDHGYLGIRLSEPVLISDVSVEHVHRDVSKNIGSAPRQWSLYGLVTDESARSQIESIASGLYDSSPSSNLPRGYTLLVRGDYNINDDEGKTIQTFPFPMAIKRLNIPIEQVVFAVGSNWGNNEYTCLYRIRVHGQGLHENADDANKGFGDDEIVS